MRLKRAAVVLAVAAAAAAFAVPYLKADRFAGSIKEALERTLHRRVVIGKVRFHLIPGLGCSIEDVVIHDDPSVGLEPFAYVTSLDVRVRWSSVLTQRLEIDRLRLQEPSVNLTKTESGEWNFQQILKETLGAPGGKELPTLEVRDGRINFKFGTLKSAFYLTNADLDLSPAPDFEDRFRLRFSGEPARTDRGAQGFGTLTAAGWWHSPRRGESELEMDLAMERSSIADMMTLVAGRDLGVHGFMTSRAHFSGKISSLDIKGELRLQDLHRWDLLPNRTAPWPVAYRGRLDLWNQRVELETVQDGQPKLPFVVRMRASEYMTQPRWAVSATVEEMPATYLVDTARQLGITFPEGFTLKGKVDGVMGYASQTGAQGQMVLKGAIVEMPGSGALRLDEARLFVNGNAYHLDPAEVGLGEDERVVVAGEYDRGTEALRFSLTTAGASQTATQAAMVVLPGSIAPPLLGECRGGVWRGSLKYAREGSEDGVWAGGFTIEKTQWSVAGIADPVKIAAATASVQTQAVSLTKVKGTAGKLAFTGEWRRAAAEKSARLQLTIPEADGEELERLLGPSLARRQNFFARALRRPAPLPDWLLSRAITGSVRIGKLRLAEAELDDVRANLQWQGPQVELEGLEARVLEARAKGSLVVNLRGGEPAYTLEGRLAQLPWRGGQWELEGKLQTAGMGAGLLGNLMAGGSLTARGLVLSGEEVKSVGGSYEFAVARGTPRLQMTGMELVLGPDTYYGQGGSQPDGKLQFELSSGRQKVRVAGSLTPLQLEIVR